MYDVPEVGCYGNYDTYAYAYGTYAASAADACANASAADNADSGAAKTKNRIAQSEKLLELLRDAI